MPSNHLILDHITYTYPESITPILENLRVHLPVGWTGVVGANGSGKTTLLRIAAGELTPLEGAVLPSSTAVLCHQRTDCPPAVLSAFLASADADACRLRGCLDIRDDWAVRWETLSHGERKRAQIGVALWQRPDVLAVDEPTNHIDEDTRRLLMGALGAFSGVGIIVSHDRVLLDALCGQCLFLDEEGTVRPGGYSQGAREQNREKTARQRERRKALLEYRRLKREMGRRRAEAANADRQRSKKGLSRKDHDAREKIDRARITGKDGVAGKRLNQLSGRLRQTGDLLASSRAPKERTLGIWMSGSTSVRDFLCTVGDGSLPVGGGRRLHVPVLDIRADDHVGITGPNGSGKSTLVMHIVRNLAIPATNRVYVPQEITAEQSVKSVREIRRLSNDKLGRVMEIVSRLNSRPERLLDTDLPSPGEMRKLTLALGILRNPQIIIMDEPTNHLDLPSIECLERALADCPCALLLVSHDRRFLAATTDTEWRLTCSGGDSHLEVHSGFGKSGQADG